MQDTSPHVIDEYVYVITRTLNHIIHHKKKMKETFKATNTLTAISSHFGKLYSISLGWCHSKNQRIPILFFLLFVIGLKIESDPNHIAFWNRFLNQNASRHYLSKEIYISVFEGSKSVKVETHHTIYLNEILNGKSEFTYLPSKWILL